MKQLGFFDLSERQKKLLKTRDFLERINAFVGWEAFRPALDAALNRPAREKGGRPPFDAVLMFKVLVLQALYNLSDEQTEYQILDRLSFMKFLGLELHDDVPDARTIWLFRETLIAVAAVAKLFDRFDAMSTVETKCANWRRDSVPAGLREKGFEAPVDNGAFVSI